LCEWRRSEIFKLFISNETGISPPDPFTVTPATSREIASRT